jgi:hypothetical protein
VNTGCGNCASALWNRERFGIHRLRQVHLRSHRHTLRVLRFGDMANEFAERFMVWHHYAFTSESRIGGASVLVAVRFCYHLRCNYAD